MTSLTSTAAGGRRFLEVAVDSGCVELWPVIRRAIERHAPVMFDVDAVMSGDEVTRLSQIAIILVGARTRDGAPTDPLIARIRDRFRHVGVFVCAGPEERALSRLPDFSRAGADEVFPFDTDADVRIFRNFVRRWIAAPPPDPELREIGKLLTPSLERTAVEWCIRDAFAKRSPEEVARHFGMDRTTLTDRLRKAGLPPPGELLRLGLVLHALELRRSTRLTQEQIAGRLGLGGAKALAMKRWRLRNRAHASRGNQWLVLHLLGEGPSRS